MLTHKRLFTLASLLLVTTLLIAGCATPATPETVVETVIVKEEVVVTQEVEKIVEKTVEVEVEKEVIVTKEVEVEKEVVKEVEVTSTPEPGRQTLIVALSQAPTSLDPADHRLRQSETVIRNMFDGLVNTSGPDKRLAALDDYNIAAATFDQAIDAAQEAATDL